MVYKRIRWFLSRPDVQQNPLKAVWKRLVWRLRWLITSQPFTVPLGDRLKITTPKSGSGASIYYFRFSEPETADFILRFLQTGMVMLDVGAHIGEYTLLAAQKVGSTGQIHAFEPQAHIFPVLSRNVEINEFSNVKLNRSAVCDLVGEMEFEISDEPAMSSLRKHENLDNNAKVVCVPSTSLDEYWSNHATKIDLIKVDVEGAEKFVFQGATKLLSLPVNQAPTWIFEYAPNSYASFEYHSTEILELLKHYGYGVWQYCGAGIIREFKENKPHPEIINLIAAKGTPIGFTVSSIG
ncbi:methyltransferase FkbM family protein [Calothrix sp. NIES-4101]|nr:methyltransferase FkbM family protein [Calothrix sp. NIES-4101]